MFQAVCFFIWVSGRDLTAWVPRLQLHSDFSNYLNIKYLNNTDMNQRSCSICQYVEVFQYAGHNSVNTAENLLLVVVVARTLESVLEF